MISLHPARTSRRRRARAGLAIATLAVALLTVTGCGRDPIAAAVEARDRPQADRARDADRKPAEVLAFLGIRPGMRVGQILAGSGYYTELLARIVGPDGHVWAQNSTYLLDEGGGAAWNDRLERFADIVTPLETAPDAPGFPSGLDAVLLIRQYHDLFWLHVDRAALNRAVFTSLRPGGIYAIIDHADEPGTRDLHVLTLHRIDPELVREEVEAAGFRLEATSDLLANPDDPHLGSVYSDPLRFGDRADRFVMKFVKPRE